jgi:methionyl-tRNA formyltransferase
VRVLHLGGNRLGERIHQILERHHGQVLTVTDLDQLALALERETFDYLVSAGFRHIVPDEYLKQVSEAYNVHISMLPWGKGAHPNVWMIVDGEPAGVSIHQMVPAADAGLIFAQRGVDIYFSDSARDLYYRLEDEAVELFDEVWPELAAGNISGSAQRADGSHHRSSDFSKLAAIDLNDTVTWRRALDIMRALTFPPYRNLVVEVDGRYYHVEVDVSSIDDHT